MRILVLTLLLISSTYAEDEVHICYFSLNNPKEYNVMKKLSERLNRYSERKIKVTEFQSELSKPEESFKAMAMTAKCDGLVISGHHTGSFGGQRASGTLSVDFLERISCDPMYKNFFSNINALWLQGCRTMGIGENASIETEQTSADFHTQRVGDVLEQDHLEQSLLELNLEFSATLDKDNPLSSRYLRVFPKASIFGWTATAPGILARSEMSIPYHMAHIARLNGDEFTNPTTITDPKVATVYTSIVFDILAKNQSINEACADQTETSIKAWHAHGGREFKGNRLSFSNTNLQAKAPMFLTEDESLKLAKQVECMLSNEVNENKLKELLDKILSDPKVIGYSLNRIHELLQRHKTSDPSLYDIICNRLKDSQNFKYFLMEKISSKRTGILRKIDYLALIAEVYKDLDMRGLRKQLKDSFYELVLKDASENYDLLDFQNTIAQSLSKHGILKVKDLERSIDRIIKQNKPHSALEILVKAIPFTENQNSEKKSLILKIISSKIADDLTVSSAINTLADIRPVDNETMSIVKNLMKKPKLSVRLTTVLANIIALSSIDESEKNKLLDSFIFLKNHTSYSLSLLLSNLLRLKTISASWKTTTLLNSLNSKKLDTIALEELSYELAEKDIKLINTQSVIDAFLKHPKSSEVTRISVAIIAAKSRPQIKDASKLITRVYNSSTKTFELNNDVAFAISLLERQTSETEQILNKISQSEQLSNKLILSICKAVSKSTEIKKPFKILNKIMDRDDLDDDPANSIASAIFNYVGRNFEGMEELMTRVIESPAVTSESMIKIVKTIMTTGVASKSGLVKRIIDKKTFETEELKELRNVIYKSDYKILDRDKLIDQLDSMILR